MSALHYGLTPKMKPISPRRSTLVAALDIGSSKVACVIGRLRPHPPQQVLTRRSHAVEVVGFGHAAARGTKSGGVADLAQAEEAIRQAVDGAERMASVEIELVVLSISAGRLASECLLRKWKSRAQPFPRATSRGCWRPVIAFDARWSRGTAFAADRLSINGTNGIRDPRGMLGERFGVDMHVATTETAAARNLMLAVERCHLSVEAMVASPYVAGLSVLADDEADLGAAVVDMGAGTTTMAVFLGGRFVHAEGFALGGLNVTLDMARGLNASIADAERIKTFYGSVLAGGSDERDMITVPPVNADDREQAQFVPRSTLVEIIKPRVEEILEMVRDRLAATSFAAEARGRVFHRRCELDDRIVRTRCPHSRPGGAHRLAARHRRTAGCREGRGFRRGDGASGLSAGSASRIFRIARQQAVSNEWHGRLFLPGRTMASRELLMAPRRESSKLRVTSTRPVADRPGLGVADPCA